MGRHCQNTRPLKKETAATWRAHGRFGASEFGPRGQRILSKPVPKHQAIV